MTRYKTHRYTTVAIAFVIFITLFILTACGSGATVESSGGVSGEQVQTTTYIVNGKPLDCILIHEGMAAASNRTLGFSCDWVAYHEGDSNEVQ